MDNSERILENLQLIQKYMQNFPIIEVAMTRFSMAAQNNKIDLKTILDPTARNAIFSIMVNHSGYASILDSLDNLQQKVAAGDFPLQTPFHAKQELLSMDNDMNSELLALAKNLDHANIPYQIQEEAIKLRAAISSFYRNVYSAEIVNFPTIKPEYVMAYGLKSTLPQDARFGGGNLRSVLLYRFPAGECPYEAQLERFEREGGKYRFASEYYEDGKNRGK